MATKNTEMHTIDSCDLDVEELEERLELASLFATKASGTSGEQAVAVNWDCFTDKSVAC